MAHAIRQIGRERKFAPHRGWHFCISIAGPRDIDLVFHQGFIAHDLPAEHKGVVRYQTLDEILLDLAEHASAARNRAGRPR